MRARRVRGFESGPVAGPGVDNRPQPTMRAKWIDRALLIAILWLALGLRLSQLDAVPHDYDRSYPHGMAIALLDSLGDGTLGKIALHGQPQSLGLPNPVGANYVLALLAMLDRSPYFAMVVIAAANTLVVAIAYNVARRTGGRFAGLAAAALAATSPWAVYFARGTWQLSLLELSIAVPAWLIWRGQIRNQPRWIVTGIVVAAVAMHTYTVGFGLLLQLGGLALVAGSGKSGRRVIVIAGSVAGALSLALYGAVLRAANVDLLAGSAVRLAYAGADYGGFLAGLPINLLAIARAMGVVGGSEFESIQITTAGFADPTRALLLEGRSALVACALVAGTIALARRWRSDRSARSALAWFLVPVLAITALTTLSRSTPVNYYYVLLSSPMGYVCGGAGIAWLLSLARTWSYGRVRRGLEVAGLAIGIAGLLIPLASLGALAAQQLGRQDADTPLDLPLRTQLAVARAWKAECSELSVPFNPFEARLDLEYWAISLAGSKHPVRPKSEAVFGSTQVWATREAGATCSVRMPAAPVPPGAAIEAHAIDARFRIYRSDPAPGPTSPEAPRASIGWALESGSWPQDLRAGEPARIDLAWRIETVPTETHETWRYDSFVKLVDANGRVVAQGDVLAPPGSTWRAGDVIRQRLELAIPGDLAAGAYAAELSLYDRNLQRTAAFSPSRLAGPERITLRLQTWVLR